MKKRERIKIGIILAVIIALIASCWYGIYTQNNKNVPELTSYVDTSDDSTVVAGDDEVPLANSKVTTKTSTKTTKKTVKLKKASAKTYKLTKPTTTKTTTKTTKKSKETVTVKTTKVTSVVENYKKKSKQKVVTTKVKTTVRTTTTPVATKKTVAVSTGITKKAAASLQTASINDIAKKADKKVLDAYTTLGFNVTINSTVSYSGYFNAKAQNITLKQNDDTIYHELGHFVAFLAGNVDTKSDFVAIYNAEKSKFTGVNKAYATQSSSEYFAESYKNYVENPSALEKERPQTYDSITQALDQITDEHVKRVQSVYSSIWN